jgi:3-hydroxypropionyl-CoA synthetase (ADP-forming)
MRESNMEKGEMRSICEAYASKGATAVPEHESKRIIKGYGVHVPEGALVKDAEEAVAFADGAGYPVVLKAVSSEILHKTELKGVVVNLGDAEALRQACRGMQEAFSGREAALDGFLVEKMASEGVELIVGLQDDPNFGPVLMLGTGGVFIHLMNDVTFRVLPATDDDYREMIEEIRGKLLMRGFRGKPPLNEKALVEAMAAIGRFGVDASGLYESVDFNPVILTESEAVAVDAKIILRKETAETSISEAAPNIVNMDKFFEPRNVALIGASTTPGKIGNAVADSLINHHFDGSVFPITKGGKEVFGLKSCESLAEIPEKVDLVVVCVGLGLVPGILDQCKDLGIPAVLIVSGGGKELGDDEAALEGEIQRKSKELGIRVIGPNCIGCFNAKNRFDAFFQVHERMVRPEPGNISMTTQSGTYGASFLEACELIGASKMISYGNRVDVDEADMLAYLAQDPDTRVIGAYVEGLGDGRKYLRTAAKVVSEQKKPIVVYKSGRTQRSAVAAQSHTGAYGGSYGVYAGAMKQAGILAVDSYEELVGITKALAMQPPAKGPGIGMISNGAGPMVNAIDLFDRLSLEIAQIEASTYKEMVDHYPAFYIVKNPVDVTGSATSDDYDFAMECLLKDPNVHVIMNWFVFQDTPLDEAIVESLDKVNKKSEKPILCGAAGGPYTLKMSRAIEKVGVPMYESAHMWITAAHALVRWGDVLKRA